jgi:outer membrane protein assembly factor BamB
VTVDEPRADEVPDDPDCAGVVTQPRRTPSQVALERYGSRMRRNRLIYFAVIAVVVLALGITVGIVWSRGETAHTTLRTAPHPAPSVALQAPSPTLRQAWRSSDRTAIGTPYWGGTAVTYSVDSVRGRNGSTGAITWSYTRTDRTVCQAIQVQGVTVAIFELHGNCDQVTALDTSTGARKWTRTLDEDGQPLNGHPSYSLTQYAVMLTTASVIYTIDPAGGLDRWVYRPVGCTIQGAVIGSQGALISQTCAHPKCDGLTFCGTGPQLLLRDASAGRSDDEKDKANPDQIKWNLIGTSAVPASADQLISAVDPVARQLQVLAAAKGKPLARLTLQGAVTATEGIAAVASDRAELLWIAGTTYAVDLAGSTLLWTAPTPAPPTVTQPLSNPASPPELQASTVAVADSGGIALLDPGTGKPRRTFPVTVPASGSLSYPFGTGFLVAGPSTTVYQ